MVAAAFRPVDVRAGVRLPLEHVRDGWRLPVVWQELEDDPVPRLSSVVAPRRLVSRVRRRRIAALGNSDGDRIDEL